jgi:hypothetical protein
LQTLHIQDFRSIQVVKPWNGSKSLHQKTRRQDLEVRDIGVRVQEPGRKEGYQRCDRSTRLAPIGTSPICHQLAFQVSQAALKVQGKTGSGWSGEGTVHVVCTKHPRPPCSLQTSPTLHPSVTFIRMKKGGGVSITQLPSIHPLPQQVYGGSRQNIAYTPPPPSRSAKDHRWVGTRGETLLICTSLSHRLGILRRHLRCSHHFVINIHPAEQGLERGLEKCDLSLAVHLVA